MQNIGGRDTTTLAASEYTKSNRIADFKGFSGAKDSAAAKASVGSKTALLQEPKCNSSHKCTFSYTRERLFMFSKPTNLTAWAMHTL